MRRGILPVLALALTAFAVLLLMESDPFDPSMQTVEVTVISQQTVVTTRVVARTILVTGEATRRPSPTGTALPNCEITLFQDALCQWPTATAVLPLPTCGPREAGLVCVRQGPVQATIGGMTEPTASPALGVVVKEESGR